jgi:hypothetical protein
VAVELERSADGGEDLRLSAKSTPRARADEGRRAPRRRSKIQAARERTVIGSFRARLTRLEMRAQYIPPPGGIPAPAPSVFSAGISQMTASVLRRSDAMEAAF